MDHGPTKLYSSNNKNGRDHGMPDPEDGEIVMGEAKAQVGQGAGGGGF